MAGELQPLGAVFGADVAINGQFRPELLANATAYGFGFMELRPPPKLLVITRIPCGCTAGLALEPIEC